MKSKKGIILTVFLFLLVAGFFVPQKFVMPVKDASKSNYHPQSFWFYPWGRSGTHKGVDIFARENTPVVSSTHGWVVYKGTAQMGGNVVLVLGPKWRLHYYAHLKEIKTELFSIVKTEDLIGTVGTSGNAKGKPPHLHYSITTPIPYPWRIDKTPQGWEKMFYLNPIDYLSEVK